MNQETNTSIFKKLPQEIWQRIYLFDDTYQEKFRQCIQELEWKIFLSKHVLFDEKVSSKPNSHIESIYHPPINQIYVQMYIKMAQVLPYFTNIGCKQNVFSHGTWYFSNEYHIRNNERAIKRCIEKEHPVFWKTTIIVTLFVKKSNLDMEYWLEKCMNEYYFYAVRNRMEHTIVENSEYTDTDDENETNDTTESQIYPSNKKIKSLWEDFWAIVHESSICKIYTTISMKSFTCIFRGVKIPII